MLYIYSHCWFCKNICCLRINIKRQRMEPNKKSFLELRFLAQLAKIPKYCTMNKVELSRALGLGPVAERPMGAGKKCKHGKIERYCASCGGNGVCPHGIRKYVCIPCGGSQICKHLNQKHQCGECRREKLKQGQAALHP